jgi:hypothetical protein
MRAVAFAILVAFSSSGCATILHPERSLVPSDERGDIDTTMVVADVILSVPFLFAGLCAMAFGGGHPSMLEALLVPLNLDRRHGTLYHPKEPE